MSTQAAGEHERRGVGAILSRMAATKRKGTPPTFAEAFGARLRETRERRGMTQQELADALGIHRPRITQYETGVVVPEGETLAALGAVLEVSLDELILGRPSEQADDVRDARLRASIRELEQLHDRKLVNVVVAVVDALVAQEQHAAVQSRVAERRKK
jgi:transcriptional regulator with XRE-family HTH domain